MRVYNIYTEIDKKSIVVAQMKEKDLKTLTSLIVFLYKNTCIKNRKLWRTDLAEELGVDPAYVTRLIKLAQENNLVKIVGKHTVKLTPLGERIGESLLEAQRRAGKDPSLGQEVIMALRQATMDWVWFISQWLPAPPPNPPIPTWVASIGDLHSCAERDRPA